MKTPVSRYMSLPAHTVRPDASLAEAYELLETYRVSGLPVADERGRIVGMLTRTDLLRVGRVQTHSRGGDRPPLLLFTEMRVSEAMTPDPVTIDPTLSMGQAAAIMVRDHIHRLVVRADKDTPLAVLSTNEMLVAVHDAKIAAPIESVMRPATTLPTWAPLAFATDRLAKTSQSGIVITNDEGWPYGVFTQTEALLSRDYAEDSHVEDVMSYSLLCLSKDMPLYRAAAQAFATSARRVTAVSHRRVVGVLTGLDFARALADEGPHADVQPVPQTTQPSPSEPPPSLSDLAS